MATTKKLKLIIDAEDNASKSISQVNSKLEQTGKNLKIIGIAAGAFAIAIGKKAVEASASFEKSMSNVATLLNTDTENVEEMSKAVLDMSKRTPVALDELTSALYDVRSAGIDAVSAMSVLENSAILATAGLGTTKEATNILTSAINAFGLEASDSGQVADVFFKAVKSGKTTVSELAQGFGQVAPLANALGMSFEELLGITSAMTTSGMKASIAYTQVRAVLSNLAKPTEEMTNLMDELNISNMQAEIQDKGLQETIMKLTEATGGNNEVLAKAFGSVEALNAVMMLNNETGETSLKIVENMTTGENQLTEAYKKQNETASAQYQLLKNKLNIELINLGNMIIPKLITGLENTVLILGEWKLWFDKIADVLGTVIFKIDEFLTKVEKAKRAAMGVFTLGVSNVGFAIGDKIRGRASGGPVSGGTPYVVGENGPELFMPRSSGKIIPNGAGGLGNITINITGNEFVGEEGIADRLGNEIMRAIKDTIKL